MKVSLFLKNKKKGQATTEAVLIMVILVSMVMLVFGDNMKNMMNALFETPKSYLKGMVQSGVWKKAGNDEDKFKFHPNAYSRVVLTSGESVNED